MQPLMPPLVHAAYLVDYLFEFGPVKAEAPLEPPDVPAIEHVLGVEFQPWESRLLLRLSREYKGEMHAATLRNAQPPWAGAAKQWKYVQHVRSERALDGFLK